VRRSRCRACAPALSYAEREEEEVPGKARSALLLIFKQKERANASKPVSAISYYLLLGEKKKKGERGKRGGTRLTRPSTKKKKGRERGSPLWRLSCPLSSPGGKGKKERGREDAASGLARRPLMSSLSEKKKRKRKRREERKKRSSRASAFTSSGKEKKKKGKKGKGEGAGQPAALDASILFLISRKGKKREKKKREFDLLKRRGAVPTTRRKKKRKKRGRGRKACGFDISRLRAFYVSLSF